MGRVDDWRYCPRCKTELEHEQEVLDDESVSADEKRDRAERRYTAAQEALEKVQAALADLGG